MSILYPSGEVTNEWRPQYPNRPLVFLDVDGVINWSPAPHFLSKAQRREMYEKILIEMDDAHAGIRLPFWMPRLVQYLADEAEVVWLTAWKEYANPGLTETLGIRELPTMIDGTDSRFVDWKATAMTPVAHQANANGRDVIWIEDFGFDIGDGFGIMSRKIYAGIPEFVWIVDTLPLGVLRWEDLNGTALETDRREKI